MMSDIKRSPHRETKARRDVWSSIRPLRRGSLSDEIIQKIQELIAKESLRAGNRLPTEIDLAERFGVGRSTVREALRALNALGMIERSKRGTFVSAAGETGGQDRSFLRSRILKDCRLADLLEWRRLLEGAICALAARRATDEDVQQIGSALEGMEKAARENDLDAFVEADAAFHVAVAEAAHNQVTDRMLRLVRNEMVEEIGEALSRDAGLIRRALESHRLIFRAIKNENPNRARALITAHLEEVTRAIHK